RFGQEARRQRPSLMTETEGVAGWQPPITPVNVYVDTTGLAPAQGALLKQFVQEAVDYWRDEMLLPIGQTTAVPKVVGAPAGPMAPGEPSSVTVQLAPTLNDVAETVPDVIMYRRWATGSIRINPGQWDQFVNSPLQHDLYRETLIHSLGHVYGLDHAPDGVDSVFSGTSILGASDAREPSPADLFGLGLAYGLPGYD